MAKKVKPAHGGGLINRFEKGETGNPTGRPKRAINVTWEEKKYTIDDIRGRMKVLLHKNLSELQTVVKDDKTIMLDKIVSNALIQDLRKGVISTLESVMNRVWGTPTNKIEHTGKDGTPIHGGTILNVSDDTALATLETALKSKKFNKEKDGKSS